MIKANAVDYRVDVYSERSATTQSFCNEGGLFTELWDLLGILLYQKSIVDRLTDKFLTYVRAMHCLLYQDRFH
jgi:hypothetical protein